MSKIYYIPVVWTMCDTLKITANSYEEACNEAYDTDITFGEYLPGSFEIDKDSVELFNPEYLEELNNKEDEN